MKLANPNANLPFNRIDKDAQGNETYGYRTVDDGTEEIVHIPTGESNMNYYTPDKVTNYENCKHKFRIVRMGTREVECQYCRLITNFHPAVNFKEENGKAYILLNYQPFEIV
jgi:hypothetical protein